jgi:hypothetical protein
MRDRSLSDLLLEVSGMKKTYKKNEARIRKDDVDIVDWLLAIDQST